MRSVYLINLSVGLAGIERRFVNIWRELNTRRCIRSILVIPDTQAGLLYRAGLAVLAEKNLWVVPEAQSLRALSKWQLRGCLGEIVAFLRGWSLARRYRSVLARIARDPQAIIHVGLNCSSLDLPAVPAVYECVDSTLTQLGTRHYVKASAKRCIVHCQTNRIRAALEQMHAHRHPKWTAVTSPCYFTSYHGEPAVVEERDHRLVMFVGRFAPEKSPLLFVDTIHHVRRAGLDVRAKMLGEGPYLKAVLRRISSLGLDGVISVGFSRTPAQDLSTAGIFVTLQTGDNYGSQSLLEAMGAGCAIVASDVGETRRIVTDDVGFVVEQTATAVAGAIARLVCDPALMAGMGAAAARVARTRFSASVYSSFLESLYRQAVCVTYEADSRGANGFIPSFTEQERR